MSADVYYSGLRAGNRANLMDKLERLFHQAGLEETIDKNDLVAIKIHFGEPGNLAYIRPPYVRRMVDKIKSLKGRPFLTDTNTLYYGKRGNAVDHLESAVLNGFDYAVVGAPVVIGDGLQGLDFVKVKINGEHFKQVDVASAIYHADAMLVMTHFKCHEMTGAGGNLKNVGMGCASRNGKQQMHSDVLPRVNEEICKGCKKCSDWCPASALKVVKKKALMDEKKCLGCGECVVMCPHNAIGISWRTTPRAMQEKMAEYTMGVLTNKKGKTGYITFVTDISPECDCYGFNDKPIVQDIGILAGKDPVAIDQACIDLVNRAQPAQGSVIENLEQGKDKFEAVHPGIHWHYQLEHAEKLGLGSRQYNLVEVK
ncbi:MAG: DUF362 domain-containing protein [Chitinophagales bacterium]